ncbi:LOW QUALITY PROTEIN: uncharacterized protein LOC112684275 [Sipha flava]|uniref:LOW QUALITY PROTEIN: uncharacterized protein LOC112684275 n=1 Tax=Sipha flava TaxID=143950 RepID=A0A8B8FLH7_9HEMI|nr:LOW QUALITY PROTEIN: uncharacterized protein LOC112684275 [Sipha flava]
MCLPTQRDPMGWQMERVSNLLGDDGKIIHSKNEGKIERNTVYNCSFSSYVCGPREKPIKQNDHLVMAGNIDCLTVNRMSYPIHYSPRVDKIVPRDHCLGGKGPMKKETTMVHDFYIPCDINRQKKILPRNNLRGYDDCPMNSLTTNNCSYQPVCTVPVISYKPKDCYSVPKERMNTTTVQKLSYKYNCPPEKMKTPWATKMEYCKPKNRVENCTVYNQSFQEPGHYVSIDESVTCVPRTCCPVGCLAANAENKFKTNSIKAHHY